MTIKPQRPQRGEIWYCHFSPVVGSEQGGRRPAVIVSNDGLNNGASNRVIVCPLTGHLPRTPLHILVPAHTSGLSVDSSILLEQIRSVSLERLAQEPIGSLPAPLLETLARNLRRLLAI